MGTTTSASSQNASFSVNSYYYREAIDIVTTLLYPQLHNQDEIYLTDSLELPPNGHPQDITHHLAPLVKKFNRFYKPIHGPLSLAICVFGIICNTLNVALLVKKRPLGGTNHLVTGLAVGQIGLLASFLCFSVVNHASGPICDHRLRTHNLMTFVLFNVNVNLVFTMISVFHVTMLALARYSVIMKGLHRISASTPLLLQPNKVIITVISIYIVTPLLCIPLYFNSKVDRISKRLYNDCHWEANITAFQIGFSNYSFSDLLMRFNFWFFGILGKLVPCILMVFLNMMLVCKLKSLRKRQGVVGTTTSAAGAPSRRRQNYSNTSNVLLLVISLFFIVEFPQGILNLLSGLLGENFAKRVYSPLGDFFEMLTVLYSSINFVLYCIMSTQFRRAFVSTFLPYCSKRVAVMGGCRTRLSISVGRANAAESIDGKEYSKGVRVVFPRLLIGGKCQPSSIFPHRVEERYDYDTPDEETVQNDFESLNSLASRNRREANEGVTYMSNCCNLCSSTDVYEDGEVEKIRLK